ncbi:MAG TPA: DMT family transporter [Anaeromyxobacteraceae bacterium]|nr:DMT family transporter [Anaeromyxobacteraceae bacterium]
MADLALLLLTLAWGTTFTFVKDVLEVASPGLFLAARFGVAAAVLAAVWAVRRDRPTPGLWRHGLLLGLAMLAGFALQTLGLRFTTPARSGFITGLSVLVVPFLARFVLGRPVKGASWGGVALAVVGLGVLSFAEGVTAEVRVGDLLTLGCALAYALQIVWTSEWAPRHPLAPFVLAQVLVTAVAAGLAVPFEGAFLRAGGADRFAATVAYTGVVMTAGTFFVMNWAQRHTTAVRAALIFSLEPVSAALFSHLYGGEPLGPPVWIGGALIVAGVLLGEVGGALEARAGRAEAA